MAFRLVASLSLVASCLVSTVGAQTSLSPTHEEQKVIVGKKAPDVVALNLAGGWYDYPVERTVLLTFWSMNDADAEEDMARLAKIRGEFSDVPNFLMITVLVEGANSDDWDKWSNYCVDKGMVTYNKGQRPVSFVSDPRWWQMFTDPGPAGRKMLKEYGIDNTPQFFLLGPNRCTLASEIPKDVLQDVVAKHLAKGRPASSGRVPQSQEKSH
ncbi:MAG: hypothetical protein KDA93_14055 [Planctomycetaceae bacterium]|nr:hypothetical protein [Planctomycetaceae bacterium]